MRCFTTFSRLFAKNFNPKMLQQQTRANLLVASVEVEHWTFIEWMAQWMFSFLNWSLSVTLVQNRCLCDSELK